MTRERIILIIAIAWGVLATVNCERRVDPEQLGRATAELRRCEMHHENYRQAGRVLRGESPVDNLFH
jgi:hypothetical protein